MNIFSEYDKIVGKTLEAVGMLTEKDEVISISDFDIKNRDHLFVFNIAKILSELSDKPVVMNVNPVTWVKLKLMYPKFKIKLGTGMFSNVNTKELIKMLYDMQPQVGYFAPWQIYDAYYSPNAKGE